MFESNRIKTTVVAIIVVIALLGTAVTQSIKVWKERTATLYPRRTLVVVIETSQNEAFFERLTEFAEVNEFKIHIGQTTPEGGTFNVNMSRKDVMIIANNVFDQNTFDIAFYDKNPARPASQQTIDDLLNDLKKLLSEVSNLEISEP